MTKILGICGSAAPKSSTKKLIETALDAAKAAGAEVEFIDAAKMDIHGCRGCLACKKDQAKFCVQKDDMTPLYEKIVCRCCAHRLLPHRILRSQKRHSTTTAAPTPA